MDDPKILIVELTKKVEQLTTKNAELREMLDTAGRQADEAMGNSARLERALKTETENFRKQIDVFKSLIDQNQKSLLSLIEAANKNLSANVKTVSQSVSESTTAVTTLTSDFESQTRGLLARISQDHDRAMDYTKSKSVSVIDGVGRQVRASLGSMQWFPWVTAAVLVVVLGTAGFDVWQWFEIDRHNRQESSAVTAVIRLGRELGTPIDNDAWDAWLKKNAPKEWAQKHEGEGQ